MAPCVCVCVSIHSAGVVMETKHSSTWECALDDGVVTAASIQQQFKFQVFEQFNNE